MEKNTGRHKDFQIFSISRSSSETEEFIQISPKTETASFAYALETLISLLNTSHLQPLQNWLEPKKFKITDKKGILTYVHLDVLCAFDYYSKVQKIDELVDYICLETKASKTSSLFKSSKDNRVRSNIHTLNKNSFFFDTTTGEIRLKKECLTLRWTKLKLILFYHLLKYVKAWIWKNLKNSQPFV